MKNLKLTIFLLVLSLSVFAQKDPILFTVNEEPVKVSEFKRVYEKNLDLVNEEAKDIDKNLDLYINYKLKVKEAYDLKLDTSKTYKRELRKYKQQLIEPYLQDEEFKKKQVRDAYDRTKEEVRASHILVLFPKKQKVDTIAMIAKLEDIRNRSLKGESFEKLAKEFSEDPSAKQNGGDLGYFSAFRMVFPFEETAYTTAVGDISKPFKTRFGYHILKVTDKRLSKGEFEAAHILIKGTTDVSKAKIDEAYAKIKGGTSFEDIAKKVSEDKGSATVGGKLRRFGSGTMVVPFENALLSLKNEGDYSKPFKTKFGWHIVKLLKRYPIGSFEDMKAGLTKKIMTGKRGGLSKKAVIDRLKNDYNIQTNQDILNTILETKKVQDYSEELVSINEKKIAVEEFQKYMKQRRIKISRETYNQFLNTEVLNYFKKDLETNNTDLRNTLSEYKDGLLLFDLMQEKIWKKSSKDSLGLQAFFKSNKDSYKETSLEKIKGKVTNDYQKHLEESWIQELRSKNIVAIRKKVLKKFKKSYNQK